MKVIIAGGRYFDKVDIFYETIKEWVSANDKITEIVCGMAQGADMMGYSFGQRWDIPVKQFPADWNKHGKSAGPIRNKEMAEYADGLIAFWDGKSRGTANMIKTANDLNLKVLIVKY